MNFKNFLEMKNRLLNIYDAYLADDPDTPYITLETLTTFLELWRKGKDSDNFYGGLLNHLYNLKDDVAKKINAETEKDGE